MENWTLKRLKNWGRKSSLVVIICFAIPFAEGVFIGFQHGAEMISERKAEEKYEQDSFFTIMSNIFFLPALSLAMLSAAEASGRTRQNRVTIKQLGRKYTSGEINQAIDLYHDKPEQFPWHYILMVSGWGLRLHLSNGWCGIPNQIIYPEMEKDLLHESGEDDKQRTEERKNQITHELPTD